MPSRSITCYEFDQLVPDDTLFADNKASCVVAIPRSAFDCLDRKARQGLGSKGHAWLRPTSRNGSPAVQVTNYVGVVQLPDGTHVEILPKVGKSHSGSHGEIRVLLLTMLSSLSELSHIQSDRAFLIAKRRPLLDVFMSEFLKATYRLVKTGLRGGYVELEGNLNVFKGKLLVSRNIQKNSSRHDRFFMRFDEFSLNRPENRLIHSALRRILPSLRVNHQLARELILLFSSVPVSKNPTTDLMQVQIDRNMAAYKEVLSWVSLILLGMSPSSSPGNIEAISLLYPMQKVFEAFVKRNLSRQLGTGFQLDSQVRRYSLVTHLSRELFLLKPDFLISHDGSSQLVLDTKWKLLDDSKGNQADKYDLSEMDFYQMYAYGKNYLNGDGDVALIYPKTDKFSDPLSPFFFPSERRLRLWVLPFCLREQQLTLPSCGALNKFFRSHAE